MYNLDQRYDSGGDARELTTVLEFGRFSRHVDAAGPLLPQAIFHEPVDELLLADSAPDAGPIGNATAILAVTPRRDLLLFLDVDPRADSVRGVARILFTTWRDRADLRVGETSLLTWLMTRLCAKGIAVSDDLSFGRNVHQSVFPGAALAERLLADNVGPDGVSPDVVTIVLRGTLDSNQGAPLGVRRPEILNNPRQTLVAHGRGVSLIAGWAEPVENSFALAAAGILNAVAVIHRVRRQAFDALQLHQREQDRQESGESRQRPGHRIAEARELVTTLSNSLNDLELDLSFSIEAYADSILIPELLVESFHASLRQVSALADGLANTSQIVERVAAVIGERRASLDALAQQYTEERNKIFVAVISIGSILALPPALLLAFFGVNSSDVDGRRSILDFEHYAAAYAIAWLPFLLLVTTAAVMRRRVRGHLPKSLAAAPGYHRPPARLRSADHGFGDRRSS